MSDSTWERRLGDELFQLKDRYDKLDGFIEGGPLDELAPEMQNLLRQQRDVMRAYINVLERRLALIGPQV